jgi:hypothetical protein
LALPSAIRPLEHSKIEWKRDILREPSNHYPNVLKIELQRAFHSKKAVTPMSSKSKGNQSSQNLLKGSMIGGTAILHSVYRTIVLL